MKGKDDKRRMTYLVSVAFFTHGSLGYMFIRTLSLVLSFKQSTVL